MAENQPVYIAAVRVRGKVNVSPQIAHALSLLRLSAQNTCIVRQATPQLMGMLQKVQSYVTFGHVSDAVRAQLEEKRKSAADGVYHLAPPRKGYGRKGVKKSFSQKGALGNRHEKIDDLLVRML